MIENEKQILEALGDRVERGDFDEFIDSVNEVLRVKAVKVVSLPASRLVNILDQALADLDSLQRSFPEILDKENSEYRYFLDTGFKALHRALACVKVFKTLVEK